MTSKKIQHWLIIDWKKGNTRTRKSKPKASNLGTHEIATAITIDVTIPEVDVPHLKASVEVPQPRVEASELLDVDAEDVPDWVDVVDEVLPEDPEFEDVDHYVVQVLEKAPDRPNVQDVKDLVRSRVRQAQREERGP